MECIVCFGLYCNADMGAREIRTLCVLRENAQALMRTAMRQMHLSARAYHRVLKVSRTIVGKVGRSRWAGLGPAAAHQYAITVGRL